MNTLFRVAQQAMLGAPLGVFGRLREPGRERGGFCRNLLGKIIGNLVDRVTARARKRQHVLCHLGIRVSGDSQQLVYVVDVTVHTDLNLLLARRCRIGAKLDHRRPPRAAS